MLDFHMIPLKIADTTNKRRMNEHKKIKHIDRRAYERVGKTVQVKTKLSRKTETG